MDIMKLIHYAKIDSLIPKLENSKHSIGLRYVNPFLYEMIYTDRYLYWSGRLRTGILTYIDGVAMIEIDGRSHKYMSLNPFTLDLERYKYEETILDIMSIVDLYDNETSACEPVNFSGLFDVNENYDDEELDEDEISGWISMAIDIEAALFATNYKELTIEIVRGMYDLIGNSTFYMNWVVACAISPHIVEQHVSRRSQIFSDNSLIDYYTNISAPKIKICDFEVDIYNNTISDAIHAYMADAYNERKIADIIRGECDI